MKLKISALLLITILCHNPTLYSMDTLEPKYKGNKESKAMTEQLQTVIPSLAKIPDDLVKIITEYAHINQRVITLLFTPTAGISAEQAKKNNCEKHAMIVCQTNNSEETSVIAIPTVCINFKNSRFNYNQLAVLTILDAFNQSKKQQSIVQSIASFLRMGTTINTFLKQKYPSISTETIKAAFQLFTPQEQEALARIFGKDVLIATSSKKETTAQTAAGPQACTCIKPEPQKPAAPKAWLVPGYAPGIHRTF